MNAQNKAEKFGERLRLAIERAGYANIQQFCLDKRYPTNQLYRWIKSGKYPRVDIAQKLAQDLGVAVAWLLFGDEGIRTIVKEPIPRPKIALTGGGAGAAPLPTQEFAPDEKRDGGLCQPDRKPLAPVRQFPRRVARAS